LSYLPVNPADSVQLCLGANAPDACSVFGVIAVASSWWLPGEAMGVKGRVGGAMIVLASLFSGHLEPARLRVKRWVATGFRPGELWVVARGRGAWASLACYVGNGARHLD